LNKGKTQILTFSTRSSGHKITGLGVANPTALIHSSVNMLRTMGYASFGDLIERAVYNVYREGKYLTSDVGGSSKINDFTNRVIEEIEKIDSN
jgi:isocitrate/isopropylmalate dehydrogenase